MCCDNPQRLATFCAVWTIAVLTVANRQAAAGNPAQAKGPCTAAMVQVPHAPLRTSANQPVHAAGGSPVHAAGGSPVHAAGGSPIRAPLPTAVLPGVGRLPCTGGIGPSAARLAHAPPVVFLPPTLTGPAGLGGAGFAGMTPPTFTHSLPNKSFPGSQTSQSPPRPAQPVDPLMPALAPTPPGGAQADFFELGYHIGRVGTLGMEDSQQMRTHSRVWRNAQRHWPLALALAKQLGLDPTVIEALINDGGQLTRGEYEWPGRSKQVMDDLQNQCGNGYGAIAAKLFVQGVWLGGAEEICEYGLPYPVAKRPGTYGLLQRNTSWLQEGAQTLKLSRSTVDQFARDLERGSPAPGRAASVSFSDGLAVVKQLHAVWLGETSGRPDLPRLP